MKIRKCSNNTLAIIIFFLVNAFCNNAISKEINIYWSGQVSNIVEFKENAIPAGISVGDKITGTLRFDQGLYDHEARILGNMNYGNVYRYISGLKQSIHIGMLNWALDNGELTLSSWYDREGKSFDVYTTSTDPFYKFTYIEFPNHCEDFSFGFVIGDDKLPLNFYDTYSLNEANFNLNEVTSGSGHLSTRTWDSNGDIVDGYYIEFVISEVRLTSGATAPIVTGKTQTNDTTPTWNWASGGGGNGKYRYRLNGGTWTVARVTTFTPATALPEGRHTLLVQESDAAGKWSVSGVKSIVIDLTPPIAPAVTGDTPTNDITPSWNWVSGGDGNGKYRYRLNNGTWTVTRVTSFTPATALPAGHHTLYVQESDAAGNWSVSGTKNIGIDLIPPTAPIINGTTPTSDTTPTWNWTSGGGGNGNYRYRFASGTWVITREKSYTPDIVRFPGRYTLYVQESDAAGNWSVSGIKSIVNVANRLHLWHD